MDARIVSMLLSFVFRRRVLLDKLTGRSILNRLLRALTDVQHALSPFALPGRAHILWAKHGIV